MDYLPENFRKFQSTYPAVSEAYDGLDEQCNAAGPLDRRARRLVKLGIAIGAGAAAMVLVAKLMRLLRRVKLVTSTRGQKGGYQLARPAAQINVAAALSSLGGHFQADDFCSRFAGNQPVCVHDIDCTIRTLWATLDRAVQGTLGRLTLQDLAGAQPAGLTPPPAPPAGRRAAVPI